MSSSRRAFYGALGGLGGTLVLTGFRKVLAASGALGTTAPEQVVERLEELGLLDGWSPEARRVLTLAAHLAYGVGTGTAMGLLRRERGGVMEEATVGSALGFWPGERGGPAGCHLAGSTSRRGSSKARRCSCRSSTTSSSAPFGESCTGPRGQIGFKYPLCTSM